MNSNLIFIIIIILIILIICGIKITSSKTKNNNSASLGSGDSGTSDSGTSDSGTSDSGTSDSGTSDSSSFDDLRNKKSVEEKKKAAEDALKKAAEDKIKKAAEDKAKADADKKVADEAKAKAEADKKVADEAKAKAEADKKIARDKADADAKVKAAQDKQLKAAQEQADANAKADADAQAKAAKAKADADAQAKKAQDAHDKIVNEQKAKLDADAKANADANAKAKAANDAKVKEAEDAQKKALNDKAIADEQAKQAKIAKDNAKAAQDKLDAQKATDDAKAAQAKAAQAKIDADNAKNLADKNAKDAEDLKKANEAQAKDLADKQDKAIQAKKDADLKTQNAIDAKANAQTPAEHAAADSKIKDAKDAQTKASIASDNHTNAIADSNTKAVTQTQTKAAASTANAESKAVTASNSSIQSKISTQSAVTEMKPKPSLDNVSGLGEDLSGVAKKVADAAKKEALKKLKMVKISMSKFITKASTQLGVLKPLSVYGRVNEPGNAMAHSGDELGADLEKNCDRLAGLEKDSTGNKIEALEKSPNEMKSVSTMTASDTAKAATLAEKMGPAAKALFKGAGKVLKMGGPAIMAYQVFDYSKTHSRSETAMYAYEQRLQMQAFDLGAKAAGDAYKLGKTAYQASKEGVSIGEKLTENAAKKAAEKAAEEAIEKGAISIAKKELEAAAQKLVCTLVRMLVVDSEIEAVCSILTPIGEVVGTAVGYIVDIGMLIYMAVEMILDHKKAMRLKKIASNSESMKIASKQSISNTLQYLLTRDITMPDSDADIGFISQNYVGIYDSTSDTFVMTLWSDMGLDDLINIANNNNECGMYIFTDDVRILIKNYMIDNTFFYYDELVAGSVTYSPYILGVQQDPIVIITPSVADYYGPINKGATTMYKFMCNTSTELWSYVKYFSIDTLKPYNFPLTGGSITEVPPTPAISSFAGFAAVPASPGSAGYYFHDQIEAINLETPMNNFYTNYKQFYDPKNDKNKILLNPYTLVQKARQLLSMNDTSLFDFSDIDNRVLPLFIDFCNDTTHYFYIPKNGEVKNIFITQSIDMGNVWKMVVKCHIFPNIDIQDSLFSFIDKFYKNMINDGRIIENHYELSIDYLDNIAYMYYMLGLDNAGVTGLVNAQAAGINPLPVYNGTPTISDKDIDVNTGMVNMNTQDMINRFYNLYKQNNSKTVTSFPPVNKVPLDNFNNLNNYVDGPYTKTKLKWLGTDIFNSVYSTLAGILYCMIEVDKGFGMNVLGYIYNTKKYYQNLATKYLSHYGDVWIASAYNMIPATTGIFDNKLLEYFNAPFCNFYTPNTLIYPISDPCYHKFDNNGNETIISLRGLIYDGSISTEQLAIWVDGIYNCMGYTVGYPNHDIQFYEYPRVNPDLLCLRASKDILFTFYKKLNPIRIFTDFLEDFRKYGQSDSKGIINQFYPSVPILLNYERRCGMQVVGKPLSFGSMGEIAYNDRKTFANFINNYAKNGNPVTVNPLTYTIIQYEIGSYIVPSDDPNSPIFVYTLPGANKYLENDPLHPDDVFTTKNISSLVPDQTKLIPTSNLTNKNNYSLTRSNPGLPFTNVEIAENYKICIETKDCKGFNADPKLANFNFFYPNKLLTTIDPKDTTNFYSMTNTLPGNSALVCESGIITTINPNACANLVSFTQLKDNTFIFINWDDRFVYTLKSLSFSRGIKTNIGNVNSITQLMDGTFAGFTDDNYLFSLKDLQSIKKISNVVRGVQVICNNGPSSFILLGRDLCVYGSEVGLDLVNDNSWKQITHSNKYNYISKNKDGSMLCVGQDRCLYNNTNNSFYFNNKKYCDIYFAIQLNDLSYLVQKTDNKLYQTGSLDLKLVLITEYKPMSATDIVNAINLDNAVKAGLYYKIGTLVTWNRDTVFDGTYVIEHIASRDSKSKNVFLTVNSDLGYLNSDNKVFLYGNNYTNTGSGIYWNIKKTSGGYTIVNKFKTDNNGNNIFLNVNGTLSMANTDNNVFLYGNNFNNTGGAIFWDINLASAWNPTNFTIVNKFKRDNNNKHNSFLNADPNNGIVYLSDGLNMFSFYSV